MRKLLRLRCMYWTLITAIIDTPKNQWCYCCGVCGRWWCCCYFCSLSHILHTFNFTHVCRPLQWNVQTKRNKNKKNNFTISWVQCEVVKCSIKVLYTTVLYIYIYKLYKCSALSMCVWMWGQPVVKSIISLVNRRLTWQYLKHKFCGGNFISFWLLRFVKKGVKLHIRTHTHMHACTHTAT